MKESKGIKAREKQEGPAARFAHQCFVSPTQLIYIDNNEKEEDERFFYLACRKNRKFPVIQFTFL